MKYLITIKEYYEFEEFDDIIQFMVDYETQGNYSHELDYKKVDRIESITENAQPPAIIKIVESK